jgi:hypothetical protein
MADIEYIDPDYDWYTPDDEREPETTPEPAVSGSAQAE